MTFTFIVSLVSSVASALLLFFLCQAVGWTWAQSAAAGSTRESAWIRLMAGFGAGLWIVSITVMLWGMTVGLSFEKNLMLWIALIAGAARSLRPLCMTYREAVRGLKLNERQKIAVAVLLILTLWGLVFALTPPLFTDVVRYHFGVPHRWWLAGTIEELPHFSEQHLVMMWQHASLLLIGLEQPAAAKVFCFLAFPMTLGAVALLVHRLSGRPTAAFFAAVMLAATPTFFGNSVLGAVDAGLAFFTAMALLFFFERHSTFDLRHSSWVGVMAGLAFCTKWQGLALLPALLAAGFLAHRGRFLRPAISMTLVCALMFLPWGLRNWAWSGDPLYPFLAQFFDPAAAREAARFDGLLSHYGLSGQPWWQYLLYPLHLSFAEHSFWFGGRIEFESWIGWMYLIMLPFCVAGLRQDVRLRALMLFAVVCFILGLVQGELPRFLMPAWVALAVASGWAWKGFGATTRRALAVVLGVASLWNLTAVTRALNADGFAPLAFYRAQGADRLYLSMHPEWRVARWAALHFPNAPVFLIGLDGNFLWSNPVIVDGPFNDKTLVQIARVSKDSEEIAAQLKARGIGLVAVDSRRAEMLDKQFDYMGWDRQTRDKIGTFLRDRVVRVYWDGNISLGTIK